MSQRNFKMKSLLEFSKISILARVPVRKYAAKKMVYFEHAHMNELPVPCAPWDVWYNSKQKKYTAILIVGIGWFVGSLVTMVSTGCFYTNSSPPDKPAPPVFPPDEEDSELPNIGLPPC